MHIIIGYGIVVGHCVGKADVDGAKNCFAVIMRPLVSADSSIEIIIAVWLLELVPGEKAYTAGRAFADTVQRQLLPVTYFPEPGL